MDTMRGNFGSLAESDSYDPADEEHGREVPPASIGQDERRMQVRAYNHWASLLGDRNFPSIEDLEPDNLPDFGPYSVLLDFSSGIEDPGIAFLGDMLAAECDIGDDELNTLADVPSRSLLSRITDHYMQIIANQAPIGFEAEFVNQRGATIAYRGILLPYSSDDDTIDFIYGVINWKELADAKASDELLLEIDQALEAKPEPAPGFEADGPLTDWADGPGGVAANDITDGAEDSLATTDYAFDGLGETPADAEAFDQDGLPMPSFGLDEDEGEDGGEDGEEDEDEGQPAGPRFGSLLKMPLQLSAKPLEPSEELPAVSYDDTFDDSAADLDEFELTEEHLADADGPGAEGLPIEPAEFELTEDHLALVDQDLDEPVADFAEPDALEPATGEPGEPPFEAESAVSDAWNASAEPEEVPEAGAWPFEPEGGHEIELPEIDPSEMELGDWLAAAREMAAAARGSEERTRDALYEAIGRAYDFSLAAAEQPADFDELLADSGLTVQERAPMTPVVKLVFGADYDKTRLTEYAAALTHAHRLGLTRGTLGEFLSKAEGGLKGVVKAERRLRKEEAGKAVEPIDAPRHALARKLRAMPAKDFEAIAADGSEFALVMIRRTDEGEVVMLGEVPDDVALVERAARRLIG
jgi:hypothetical protein